jgi:protocatechuate 3,4-dioxygenase, beta subunit
VSDDPGYRPRDWSSHAPYLHPEYRSTALRSPSRPLIALPHTLSEVTGPVFGHSALAPLDSDLVINGAKAGGEALGQRINVGGRVLDENGRPVAETLIEIWQANACGRYIHPNDPYTGPLDPNFFGAGRAVTDAEGRYRFRTIRPGAYPWGNHHNAWRPAHIHFSLFGPSFVTRLVTQMYFPDDPLFPYDPIFNACPDPAARQRMVSTFDFDLTEPNNALGFRFDIVLRGPNATPRES